jgi:hydrogenase maturation protease
VTGPAPPGAAKVVVIALGNRYRGDDGVGPHLAARLGDLPAGCAVLEGVEDSMTMVNAWTGARLAVVLDAAASGAPPGTLRRFEAGESPLPKELARCSSHGLGLCEAMALGRAIGRMPSRLVVYAVEARSFEPGAALSPEVAMQAERVAPRIAAEIARAAADA